MILLNFHGPAFSIWKWREKSDKGMKSGSALFLSSRELIHFKMGQATRRTVLGSKFSDEFYWSVNSLSSSADELFLVTSTLRMGINFHDSRTGDWEAVLIEDVSKDEKSGFIFMYQG
jgi:hypothetical protein